MSNDRDINNKDNNSKDNNIKDVNSIFDIKEENIPIDLNKAIKKSRIKLVTLVISVCVIVIGFVGGIIPSISNACIYLKLDDYSRMVSNLTQFDNPVYNNGFTVNEGFYKYEVGAINSVYQDQFINTQGINSVSIVFPLNKLKIYDSYVSNFYVDPVENNMDSTKTILENNPNNTAIINFSLDNSYSLDDLKEFFLKDGIVIRWLAVETGFENSHIETVSMGSGQYSQFGFPTFTSSNATFETKTLDINNPKVYMDFIKGEWKWTLDNKKLVSKYKELYIFKELESALSSPIQIYGFTAVGTTKDLLELCENEKLAYGNISGIYPWSIIKNDSVR